MLNTNEVMFWTEILIYPYSDNHFTFVVQSIRQHNKLVFYLLERDQNPAMQDYDWDHINKFIE